MRIILDRPPEMRRRHQRAQIVVSRRVLRKERQPVDDRGLAGLGPAAIGRASDRQQCADDRLHAFALGRRREGHRRIEPVAVADRRRRKAQLLRMLGERLGIDGAFQHGEGGEDAKRYEEGRRHRPTMGVPTDSGKCHKRSKTRPPAYSRSP